MTDDLREYYNARFDMFASKGWKDLVEDVEKVIKTLNSVNGINDIETLKYRQGELSVFQWLLSLKEISEKTFEELNSDGSA